MRQPYVLVLCLTLLSINSYADDDNETSTAFTVQLDEETQDIAGIQTLTLKSTELNPERQSVATLINPRDLILTRQKYSSAIAHEKISQINYLQTQKNFQHALKLQRSNVLSTRKLQQQQTQLDLAKTQFTAAQQQSNSLRLLIQAEWGKVISLWLLQNDPATLNALSTFKKQLYLIAISNAEAEPNANVFLHPFARREQAMTAHLVSYAPPNNPQQANNSPAFYYLSDGSFHTSVQRFTAWIPTQSDKQRGVTIPSSAIVWHLGLAFVYVQQNAETFQRIQITHKQLIDTQRYFIQHELQQDDILVISGAQMLLSEEFRGQIPAEDDDD